MVKEKSRLIIRNILILLIFFVDTHSALAQSPVGAGALLKQEERSKKLVPLSLPEIDKEALNPEMEKEVGQTIFIKELRFVGAAELLIGKDIDKKVQDFREKIVNKNYDFNGLQVLANRTTLLLKQEGWTLARAYLPQQDISTGVLNIAIIRGQLDSKGPAFTIETVGNKPLRVDPKLLDGIASGYLAPGDAVHKDDLERVLLLMNDLPGVEVRARLEAGEELESTRINVLAKEGALFTGSLQSNNFGNRFTGSSQLLAQAALNDPTGRGDKLSAAITYSEGLNLGQLSYGFPIGYEGWYADLALTSLEYDVIEGEASKQADFQGEAKSYSSNFRYPLIRSNDNNFSFGLGLGLNHYQDRFNSTLVGDKRIRTGNLKLWGDSQDSWQGGGRFDWSVKWVNGDLDLSSLNQQQQNDSSSFKRSGTFNKLEYGASRYQYLTDNLNLRVELSGQVASKNLDASQKFFPGGSNGVRGYPSGEASADEGQLLRTELSYHVNKMPKKIGNLELKLFYDQAWVKSSNYQPSNIPIDNATKSNRYSIASAGVGMHLIKKDEYSVNLNLARKIGSNHGRDGTTGFDSDGEANNYRFWLESVLWF